MSDDEVMDHELDCVKFARAVADRDVVEVERLRGLIPADVLPLVLAELLNDSQRFVQQAVARWERGYDRPKRVHVVPVDEEITRLRAEVTRWRGKTYELREILHNRSPKRVA